MSMDKLQQAIALIRSGDKPGGQKLLAEVVTADSGNEMAWLWLASVAPLEKRRFCLEKVLSINPNNLQAKQVLAQLSAPEPEKQQAPAPALPHPALAKLQDGGSSMTPPTPAASLVESAASTTQYWTTPVGKREARIIMVQGVKLISFDVMFDRVPRVLSQIDKVGMTQEWFEKNIALGLQGLTYKSASINRILRVRLLLKDIKIEYRDETGKDFSTEIGCKEDRISEEIMELLQKRLGEKYVRMSRPTSRTNLAIWSSIILFVPLCVTGFFYWVAQGIIGEEINGSARARGLGAILQFLGPNGVLCIGGILLLIAIVIVVSLFAKPPMETLLVRKSLSAA